jgi:hypothetical protein
MNRLIQQTHSLLLNYYLNTWHNEYILEHVCPMRYQSKGPGALLPHPGAELFGLTLMHMH